MRPATALRARRDDRGEFHRQALSADAPGRSDMSDLHGLGDPGVAGDPALPLLPDDSLLRDFLQVRALAQHVNDAARLDAFAAAHDAATAAAPDGGGIRVRRGTGDDDPA